MRWLVAIACTLVGCGRVRFDDAGATAADDDSPLPDASTAPDGVVGSWSLLDSKGDTIQATTEHAVSIDVAAGNLLFAACDNQSNSAAGSITIKVSPNIVPLTAPLEEWDQPSSYVTNIAWGIVDASAGAHTSVTVTFSGFGSYPGNYYSDCSASVFGGGTSAPQVVDMSRTVGGDGGLASCDAVDTVPGGVAFYFAARTTCVDAPTSGPFMQLGATFGNTWGAWAPTDGTPSGTELADCGNQGGWLCSMVSLTP